MTRPTVSVITSSIGRKELRKCVESVAAQTYPCRHYVYVNGPKHHSKAGLALPFHYSADVIFLPEESGAIGAERPDCNGVFAGAPYLTRADWIFYLNDDDFFDPNHVESIMALVTKHDLKWAYSLRKFVNPAGEFICEDNFNALGAHTFPHAGPPFVDNSSFAVSRALACRLGLAWSAHLVMSDRCFFAALKEQPVRYGTTGLYTTNYRIGTGTAHADPYPYLESDKIVRKAFPAGFPWASSQVFG